MFRAMRLVNSSFHITSSMKPSLRTRAHEDFFPTLGQACALGNWAFYSRPSYTLIMSSLPNELLSPSRILPLLYLLLLLIKEPWTLYLVIAKAPWWKWSDLNTGRRKTQQLSSYYIPETLLSLWNSFVAHLHCSSVWWETEGKRGQGDCGSLCSWQVAELGAKPRCGWFQASCFFYCSSLLHSASGRKRHFRRKSEDNLLHQGKTMQFLIIAKHEFSAKY